MRCLALILALCAGFGLAARAEAPPEPADYRQDDYRAPTPATLAGATVVTTAEAAQLWHEGKTLFVDVLPHAPKPAELPAGTLWHDPPHRTIEKATWLPEVGRGTLAPETEAYFRAGLDALTGGDKARPLLLFCKRDCWMSWNAGKRAVAYGYSHVYWYPEGVDGWADAGLPMMDAEPRP